MKIWSWRQAILQSQLQATTKLVLLALSTYMNDHGEGCYPSQDQVALDTSLSKRAVITHIEAAVQSGFLIKDKRKLQGKKWDANEYRASIPSENAPRSPHDEGVKDIHPTEKRGETGALEGCTTFTQGVNDVHSNSPVNSTGNSPTHTSRGEEKPLPDFAVVYQEVTKILNSPIPLDGSPVHQWLAWGAMPEVDIYPTIRRITAQRQHPPNTLKYFNQAIADAIHQRKQPLPEAKNGTSPNHQSKPTGTAKRESLGGFGIKFKKSADLQAGSVGSGE